MAVIYLDKKEKASKISVYSDQWVRSIEFPMDGMWAVVLPAKHCVKGCKNYSLHKTGHGAAKRAAKNALANTPCIIIDDRGELYEPLVSRKPVRGLREIDGKYYGVEAIGERLSDITVDRFRYKC